VAPAFTAASAYSIWTSLPLGLKVVRLNEYCRRALDYGKGEAERGVKRGRA
jgi:hypothetical protein